MDINGSLTVRVGRSGSKYIWQLYREGIVENVKFSGPIYPSEESAMAAGHKARTYYLARLEHQKHR
jgi:3-hydroxymyristoyl/3-hydroxydecanoyl-(acyl carrier protein) dehydratase